MTRRAWVLTAAWLCGSLPACTHTLGNGPVPDRQVTELPTVALAEPTSPYRPLPPLTVEKVPIHPSEERAADRSPTQGADAPRSVQAEARPAVPVSRAVPGAAQIGPPEAIESRPGTLPDVPPAPAAKPPEDPPLVAALRCFLDKRPQDAVARLDAYDKADQELLLVLLPVAALVAEGNARKATPPEMDTYLASLDDLAVHLRPRAALAIDTLRFCQRIQRFGVYEPLPAEYRFRPGDLVQLYGEVRNFTTARTDRGTYAIRLVWSGEIRDAAGKKVWPAAADTRMVFRPKKINDESRTLPHDYYEFCQFCVPDLPPGAYKLCIQVQDQGTQPPRVAPEKVIDLYVTNLRAPGQ